MTEALRITAETSLLTANMRSLAVSSSAVVFTFALIFAINSSIHSFLVVKFAVTDKIAVSVGFYYMSNACGRLLGTIGSGILYTFVGDYLGPLAGTDAVAGMAACFLAGTICSVIAVMITLFIDDNEGGLKCGSCLTIVPAGEMDEKEEQQKTEKMGNREEHEAEDEIKANEQGRPSQISNKGEEAEVLRDDDVFEMPDAWKEKEYCA